jgi:cell division protein FtsN
MARIGIGAGRMALAAAVLCCATLAFGQTPPATTPVPADAGAAAGQSPAQPNAPEEDGSQKKIADDHQRLDDDQMEMAGAQDEVDP